MRKTNMPPLRAPHAKPTNLPNTSNLLNTPNLPSTSSTGPPLTVNNAPAFRADASPLVSVVLPAFNAARTLKAALNSLFVQEPAAGCPLPLFEIIVINDGSTDDSAALLEACAQENAAQGRLRSVHLPHGGIVTALNAGLAAARGHFIARMDADDTAHPHRMALQTAHLWGNRDLTLSASLAAFGGDRANAYGFAHFVDWQNSLRSQEEIYRNRFRDTPVCHPTTMFRREAVDRWGAYADGNFAEDWELWLRWLHAGALMEKLPQTLLVWNDAPDRATRTDGRYTADACNGLRALWLARHLERHNPFHPQVWVIGGGRVARRRLAPLWRLGVRPAAYIDIDAKKIGNVVGGIPVLGREALPGPGHCCILNALTAHGAAEEAANWLEQRGYGPTDWILV